MVDTVSGFLTSNLQELARQRSEQYRELASGGTTASWYSKTPAQVQTHISSTGIADRIDAFNTFTASSEGVLRTQLAGIEQLIESAQKIRINYLPGSYTTSPVVPGFQNEVTMLRNSVFDALTFRCGENGYVFGGRASFKQPIQDIRNTTTFPGLATTAPALTANDFSYAVPGTMAVYINENGDTLNLDTVTASSSGVVAVVNALMLLAASTNGRDAQSSAASVQAATAYDALVNERHLILQQLNLAAAKQEDREIQKEMVVDINTQMNSRSPEEILAEIHRTNMLETAHQEMLLQQQKRAEKATRLMERSGG
jgi:hypothetical protein